METAPEVSAGDFNGNPPEGPELFSSLAKEIDQDDDDDDNNNMAVEEDDDEDDEADEEEEDDDGEEEEAEEDDCSNGSPADEDRSNKSHLNEEWHSGMKSSRRSVEGYFISDSFLLWVTAFSDIHKMSGFFRPAR